MINEIAVIVFLVSLTVQIISLAVAYMSKKTALKVTFMVLACIATVVMTVSAIVALLSIF
mgnify:CR=1 FL=1|jgi:hypothetical protein